MLGDQLYIYDAKHTELQRALLQEIQDKFDPEEIVADLCILYEVTNYKDESAEADFWDQYMDFYELGDDEGLVRLSLNE